MEKIKQATFIIIGCLSSLTTVAQESIDHNYIKIDTYTDINGSYRSRIVYCDELGREEQSILIGASSTSGSIASMTEYDQYGRKSKLWLQGGINGTSGSYINPETLKAAISSSNSNDEKPYSLTQYEPSPLNRASAHFGPGMAWHDNNKAVKTEYMLNVKNNAQLDCKNYSVSYSISSSAVSASITNLGSWDSGSMVVVKTTDEDSNISYLFKDRNGEVVLSRQMSGSTCYDTYYIRDDWGHLLAVLPPIAADQTKQADTWSSSSTVIANYAYLYCYDKRYRQIARKLPGCGWIFTIYDKSDFPILTQDGNQRIAGVWTVTIPDVWNRPCVIATKTGNYSLNSTIGSTSITATRNNATYSYSGLDFTPQSFLTVNYYDDYTFVGNGGIPAFSFTSLNGYGSKLTDNPAGQLSGIKSLVMDDASTPNYVYKVVYYDYHCKPIQEKATNIFSGNEQKYYNYDFVGNLTDLLHIHNTPDSRTVKNTYTYDMWGRLLTWTHKIGSNTSHTLVSNIYDAIGRVKDNIRNGNNYLKTTNTYNVRSWLTKINNPRFYEDLYYNVPQSGGTSAPRWGGDLSGAMWCFPYAANQWYGFSYDSLNRLSSAVYSDDDDLDDSFSTEYNYDKHGNVTDITRNAESDDIGPLPIDELHLSYTGNQLVNVANTANTYEFSNYYPYEIAQGTNAFAYDQNGNTTKDLNKNISSIQYNLLNLPRRITYTDGSMATYTYNSLGEKLQVVYSTSQVTASQPATNVVKDSEKVEESKTDNLRSAMVPSTINYFGDFVYNGSNLTRILLGGEGYATVGISPTYYFFLKDHLGNTRAVVQQNGTVKQKNQYYPFGKRWDDMGETFKQPYLYNGKEFDEMHDLNWYDYGARMYEPALGRFMTMDPLAEKYYSISPYAYCGNNPINNVDPNGLDIWDLDLNGNIVNYSVTKEYDMIRMVNSDKDPLCFEYGTITYQPMIDSEGSKYDLYRINGDENGRKVFEMLAQNTDVEWSLGQFDGNVNEPNVLTTSHNEKSDGGLSHFLAQHQSMVMNLDRWDHNHPGGSIFPSSYSKKDGSLGGDMGTISHFNSLSPSNHIKYNIYTLFGGQWNYHPYSKGMDIIYGGKETEIKGVEVYGNQK